MEEGSPMAGNAQKADVLFPHPISFCGQSFFPSKVVWKGEEQPAAGEQECKDYFSK